VAELVDNNTCTWNYEFIQQLFNRRDIIEIVKLPLSLLNQEDERIKGITRKGCTLYRQPITNSWRVLLITTTSRYQVNWKKLWQLYTQQDKNLYVVNIERLLTCP
jgi:hypothetical protein